MKTTINSKPIFSYFENPVTNTKPYTNIQLSGVYAVLTSDRFKPQTEKLRTIIDKDHNRRFKADNFPFVTFSGTFRYRSEKGLIKHSGLMVIDCDYLGDVESVKLQLLKDTFFETQLLFTSPNGKGLKWVVVIEIAENLSHGQHFDAISNYIATVYQIEVDKSGRDVSMICFLCFDPNAFLHPNCGKMDCLFRGEIYRVKRKKFNPSQWLDQLAKNRQFAPVPMNKTATSLQHEVEIVLCRIEAFQIDLTCSYEDWLKLGFAFASGLSEMGRNYFHRISRFNSNYNFSECDLQFTKCIKGNKTGVTIR